MRSTNVEEVQYSGILENVLTKVFWIGLGGLIIIGVLVGVTTMRARRTDESPRAHGEEIPVGEEDSGSESPPAGLALPFAIEQARAGDVDLHPFGVVRFSQDRPEYGHSGIDIPLGKNAAIFAVADGEVLQMQPAGDDRPGQNVTLRITDPKQPGEAWIFFYEHIVPDPAITKGNIVKRGQRLGRTALETSHNNHLQLSYAFNNFQYTRSHTCWVDYLAPDAAEDLTAWFSHVSKQPAFREAWQSYTREGKYELRGLLDARRFPGGPQLCYPPGTDVRLPVR